MITAVNVGNMSNGGGKIPSMAANNFNDSSFTPSMCAASHMAGASPMSVVGMNTSASIISIIRASNMRIIIFSYRT